MHPSIFSYKKSTDAQLIFQVLPINVPACLTFLRRISPDDNESDRVRHNLPERFEETKEFWNMLIDKDLHSHVVKDGHPVQTMTRVHRQILAKATYSKQLVSPQKRMASPVALPITPHTVLLLGQP